MIRDLKLDLTNKMKPPIRTSIPLRKSQNTDQYIENPLNPMNFSKPCDGKMNQYDFSLPLLPHHTSTYYSSSAFLVNKRIINPPRIQQPLADSSIVEHHRFYHESKNQNQKSSRQKQRSSNLPSNQYVYKSAAQFHENKSSTSFSQIYSSAKNPFVLPAIVKKKEKAKEEERISATSSTTISATSSSGFSLPPPPPPASGTTTNTAPKFSFNFNAPKSK